MSATRALDPVSQGPSFASSSSVLVSKTPIFDYKAIIKVQVKEKQSQSIFSKDKAHGRWYKFKVLPYFCTH